MLADEVDYVIGVDTHRDQHTLAVVVAPTGAVVAQTIGVGERAWLCSGAASSPAATPTAFVSGRSKGPATTAPGWRASSAIAARAMLEVGRSPGGAAPAGQGRPTRRGHGRPARRSPAEAMTLPRAGERQEALRRAACSRVAAPSTSAGVALVQLRSVIVTAPEKLRDELRRLPVGQAAPTLQPLPPLELADTRRARDRPRPALDSRAGSRLRPRKPTSSSSEILGHVRALVPELLNEPGVGPIVAAQLIVTWSHRDRVRSEAAFARLAGVAPLQPRAVRRPATASAAAATVNSTAHCTPSSSTAANTTPQPRDYIARRVAEGKSRREATRLLKRYLARHLYRVMQNGEPADDLTVIGDSFANAGPADGVDVMPVLRTIRSVAPHNVEDGQRIEIARMQQLLAERD